MQWPILIQLHYSNSQQNMNQRVFTIFIHKNANSINENFNFLASANNLWKMAFHFSNYISPQFRLYILSQPCQMKIWMTSDILDNYIIFRLCFSSKYHPKVTFFFKLIHENHFLCLSLLRIWRDVKTNYHSSTGHIDNEYPSSRKYGKNIKSMVTQVRTKEM